MGRRTNVLLPLATRRMLIAGRAPCPAVSPVSPKGYAKGPLEEDRGSEVLTMENVS